MKNIKKSLIILFISLSYNLIAQPPKPNDVTADANTGGPLGGPGPVSTPLDPGLIPMIILLVAIITYFIFVSYKKKINELK